MDNSERTNSSGEYFLRRIDVTMRNKERTQKGKVASESAESVSKLGPPSRKGARLEIPAGQPDPEALRSVTREWLVPRLVEKFLRVHGVELKHSRKLANRLQLSLPAEGSFVSAGADSKETRSQVKKKNQYRGLM
jgi:hypothetical protein